MTRFAAISTALEPERAILVGVSRRSDAAGTWPVDRSLDELERLADTAGARVVARMTQVLDRPIPRSFIGSGKVDELAALVRRLDADVVILTTTSHHRSRHISKKPLVSRLRLLIVPL